MQGHFNLQMLETPGLTPELVAAWKKQGLDPFKELQKYGEVGRYKTDNLILGCSPSYLYYRAWSGATPYGYFTQNYSMLAIMVLTSTSTEPSYTGEYLSGTYTCPTGHPDQVTTNAWKYFINNCVTTQIAIDPNGREAVVGDFKFIFYPGEGTSSVIRSITIWTDPLSVAGANIVKTARVRIKDSGGTPVTLNKTATRSLFVQYLFTLPTI